jgi:hypothetical protein
VSHLAERYPRRPGNSEKPLRAPQDVKTKAGHENAIGATLVALRKTRTSDSPESFKRHERSQCMRADGLGLTPDWRGSRL